MSTITVKTSQGNYDITLERGAIKKFGELYKPRGKVLIVTDSGVPKAYSEYVKNAFDEAYIYTFPEGEESKNFETLKGVLAFAKDNAFTRNSTFVAVGGGVVGDLTGLAASLYMRGVDFVNVPTTLLSQVDSSIGGKTAVDLDGVKNLVGAFYQPKAVIIDPDTLSTLPPRQFANGLAESIKMAATSDGELFSLLEENDAHDVIDTVIERSLLIKKAVVEADEKETGLRRVLNFGHTLAHAYEALGGFSQLYHGECVSLGMIPLSFGEAKRRITALLKKNGLPTQSDRENSELLKYLALDKKAQKDGVNAVLVKEIGSFEFKFMSFSDILSLRGETK